MYWHHTRDFMYQALPLFCVQHWKGGSGLGTRLCTACQAYIYNPSPNLRSSNYILARYSYSVNYGGTPLLWTPLGPWQVQKGSWLERVSLFQRSLMERFHLCITSLILRPIPSFFKVIYMPTEEEGEKTGLPTLKILLWNARFFWLLAAICTHINSFYCVY